MPKIAPEGIVEYSSNLQGAGFIDYTDIYGEKYVYYEKLVLSKDSIECLDLISEGEIQGLVSGEYLYSGNLYETGYRAAIFSGYGVANQVSNPSGWLHSIYYNEVPILSEKGQFNFQSIDTSITLGAPNGDNLHTLTSEETSTRTIGERLRGGSENAKIYRIMNRNCRGVIVNIKTPGLSETNTDNGNISRLKLDWQISYRPIFLGIAKKINFSAPISDSIFGKVASVAGYVKSTRMDFNINDFIEAGDVSSLDYSNTTDFLGWEIKIQRLTEDSTSSFKQDSTYIDSFSELYGNKFTYPNSAIVKSLFNAEFFSTVPERAFDCNLLKVKIPGNYNPITRTYSGAGFATTNGYWNGEFATGKAWTNNPAWCFYDLLTNKRYGLGRYVNNLDVNKFSLYEIGQYCDQLVYNADGGLEPRFTCNVIINSRDEAFNVINNMASIFRGMTYYANGNIYSVADLPKEPRITFTNANVEEGNFNYTTTSKRTRQSVAIVRYNDPNNFYSPSIEYIEDSTAIRKYGIRELDLTAFGCTSRGQAIRLGRWALLTNNNETETVEFVGGMECMSLRPGDLFKVIDSNRKTKRYGGRVYNINNLITGSIVTLDSTVPLENSIQYKLSVLTPSYYYDTTQVTGITSSDIPNIRRPFLQDFLFSGNQSSVSDNKTVIGLTTGFDVSNYIISGNPVFSVELGPLSQGYTGSRYFYDTLEDKYRVLNIEESEINKYRIVGLQYWDQKFVEIDSGINYQRPTISQSQKIPASPYNLQLNVFNNSATTQNNQIIHYSFLIDDYNYINNYRVFATTGQFGNGIPSDANLINILPANILQSTYKPLSSGNYKFRVYSYNEIDNLYSPNYASGNANVYMGLNITNVIISSLQLV